MISEAAKLYRQLLKLDSSEIPIIVPVFNLVSYAKFMSAQLDEYGLTSYIICDNNSTYEPMIEFLNEQEQLGKRIVRFDKNLGPRIFCETPEFLSILPEYFIITDPDIVFNKNLPKNFINKMKRIIDTYSVSKAGFAIDIFETRDKFFDGHDVDEWEGKYWTVELNIYNEKDPIYIAPIDTTFCLYKKSSFVNELLDKRSGVTGTSCVRIAGRFTCEHMGWWKDQPLTQEEKDYYSQTQIWSATENYKRSN